jgi:hypothetical protein
MFHGAWGQSGQIQMKEKAQFTSFLKSSSFPHRSTVKIDVKWSWFSY